MCFLRSKKSKISHVAVNSIFEIKMKKPIIASKKVAIKIGKSIKPSSLFEILRRSMTLSTLEFSYEALKKIHSLFGKKSFDVIAIASYNGILLDLLSENGLPENHIYVSIIWLDYFSIHGALINIHTGEIVSIVERENLISSEAPDVFSLTAQIIKDRSKAETFNSTLRSLVNRLVKELCKVSNISKDAIYGIFVIGNTIMHHLFLGLDVTKLGEPPFLPIIRDSLTIKAKDLNININKSGLIFMPPLLIGHIGSDTLSCLALLINKYKNKTVLLLDLRSTGSAILYKNDQIFIMTFPIGETLGSFTWEQDVSERAEEYGFEEDIEQKPISMKILQLIPIINYLLKEKMVLANGRINRLAIYESSKSSSIQLIETKNNIYLKIKKDGDVQYISQRDIRNFQVIKSLIYIYTMNLLKRTNTAPDEIDILCVLGYNVPKNADTIFSGEVLKNLGILPIRNPENIKIIVSSKMPLFGGALCVLDADLLKFVNKVIRKINYISIEEDQEFFSEFINALYFPNRKSIMNDNL